MQTRQKISRWYIEFLNQKGLFHAKWAEQMTLGTVPRQVNSFLCPPERTNRDLINILKEDGIEARTYFSPACHQQQTFSSFRHAGLDTTETISSRVINLPTWEEMREDDVRMVVEVLAGRGTGK